MSSRARLLVIAGQAATLLVTWPLWSARSAGPPMLPALPLPAIDLGAPLLLTLALAAYRPRVGAVVHAVVLALAIGADQTRLQPTVVSLAILLLALDPKRAPLAPAHLGALWLWAGAHKLLAAGFLDATAPAVFGHAELGLAVALAEMTLGVLVLMPHRELTRALATYAALLLHGGLAVGLLAEPSLGPGRLALVPWNLVLAGAGLLLPRARARRLELAFLLLPAGLYLGITDAYVAHALYTGDVWQTVRCDDAGCVADLERDQTLAELGVPLEPEPRLLRAHFAATCRPGEELFLTPPSFADPLPGASCPAR